MRKYINKEVARIYNNGDLIKKPRKVIKYKDKIGYIKLTNNLSSALASKKRIKIGDITYTEMLRSDTDLSSDRIITTKIVDVNGEQRRRLVYVDNVGDMPILINGVNEGEKYNLDDYIVYDSEWGTIYSDGIKKNENDIPDPIKFGVTIFKDGTIYLGKKYNSDSVLYGRPLPPTGITIPQSSLMLRNYYKLDRNNMSFVFNKIMFIENTSNRQHFIYVRDSTTNLMFSNKIYKEKLYYSVSYRDLFLANAGSNVGYKNVLNLTQHGFFYDAHLYYFGFKEFKMWNLTNLTKEQLEKE